jgi:hypothetical protein
MNYPIKLLGKLFPSRIINIYPSQEKFYGKLTWINLERKQAGEVY